MTQVSISPVSRIAIQPIHRTAESQAVPSDMQIGRVKESLIAELQRRGFQVVMENADADMLLAWHLVTQERTDLRGFAVVWTSTHRCIQSPGQGNHTGSPPFSNRNALKPESDRTAQMQIRGNKNVISSSRLFSWQGPFE